MSQSTDSQVQGPLQQPATNPNQSRCERCDATCTAVREPRQGQLDIPASSSNLYKQFRKRSSTQRNTSKFREPVVMSMLLKSQSVLGVSRVSRQHARVAVRAFAPASPAMDRLMGATRLSVLDHADEELQNLCSSKATPEEQAQCWEVRCGCLVMDFCAVPAIAEAVLGAAQS